MHPGVPRTEERTYISLTQIIFAHIISQIPQYGPTLNVKSPRQGDTSDNSECRPYDWHIYKGYEVFQPFPKEWFPTQN